MKTTPLPLILSVDNNSIIEWWTDAVFAVHDDINSLTGMVMSFGKGTVYAASSKQKFNTISSTHAELVGA